MTSRAVFLDRDGTIIVERHYLCDPEQVELIPGVGLALRALQQLKLKLVVITNQSAVGRGLLSLARLQDIHRRLRQLLAAADVRLDAIYYCPHTPADGCACRKPKSGLVERASRDLRLDTRACFVIGDKLCDMRLGRHVGARTILVRTGYGAQAEAECEGLVDHTVEGMWAVAPLIARALADPSRRRPVPMASLPA